MTDTAEKPGIADRIKHALHLDSPKGDTTTGTTAGTPGAASGSATGAGTTGPAPTGSNAGGSTVTGASSQQQGGVQSSSSAVQQGNSGATVIKSRDQLLSSDEHWQKAQKATEEARRQAAIVEAGARSHREAYEEYYKAERHLVKSKNTVEEIETRIRGIDISGKKAAAAQARDAYGAEKERLRALAADADTARSKADAVQDDINARGRDLEGQVAESKLHSDRLTSLQNEIAALRAAEEEAKQRHNHHLGLLEPLRQKRSHHKGERERLADELAKVKAELDGLSGKEGAATRALDSHASDISALEAELADLEARRKDKEAAVLARQQDLDGITRDHSDLQGVLGQHRQKVGEMTKDTQAAMSDAQARADDADRKAADLQQAQGAVAQQEGAVAGARQDLADVAAQQRELEGAGRAAAADVEAHAQRASALQAELQAAKERLDIAQAKKEELWELSKKHGGLADKASDVHYVEHVAKPAGEDPSALTEKTGTTADIAGKIQYGEHAIDHQQSAALDGPGAQQNVSQPVV